MNRKEEITEQIRELTRELDGIKKVWPEVGDIYYTVTPTGDISKLGYLDEYYHIYKLKRGLCFKTKEEATTHRDNDNLYTEIRQALKDANGDWVADYGDPRQMKRYIQMYDWFYEKVRFSQFNQQQTTVYTASDTSTFLSLIDKYGKLPVCRAFGVIE